jgi:tight adherence protein B
LALWRRATVLLERSGLPLRTVELVWLAVGGAFVAGLVAAVAALPTVLILAAFALGATLPFGAVAFQANRRRAAFENQLPDMLAATSAALRAGHSLKRGLAAVVGEVPEPARGEFSRALAEARLGRPLEEALDALATRIGSADLDYVVTAIAVQAEAGGSLAQLFELVADTVRHRRQHARRLRSLTAQGRLSAYTLTALPFGLLAVLTAINPDSTAPLFHTHVGRLLLGGSVVSIGIGALCLRRIVAASAAH